MSGDGIVRIVGNCNGASGLYSHLFNAVLSDIVPGDICTTCEIPRIYFSDSLVLEIGSILYTYSGLVPSPPVAPNGRYRIKDTFYTVTGGLGRINNISSCL